MNEWIARYAFAGTPTMEWIEALEADLVQLDGSVAAQPLLNQWTVTLGATAESAVAAVLELEPYLRKFDLESPLAVEVMSFDEYERRAQEPTLPVLVGSSEVGEMLSVSRQRVHQLRSNPLFPAPLVEVAMGPMWDERAVEAFAREWKRQPGRPAKN